MTSQHQGSVSVEAGAVTADRARELLDSSSASVRSELAHAEGWLASLKMYDQTPEWKVEPVAGALGEMANAWGRLNLWSRANGTYDAVHSDLTSIMNDLVQVRRMLVNAQPLDRAAQTLATSLEHLQRTADIVRSREVT